MIVELELLLSFLKLCCFLNCSNS